MVRLERAGPRVASGTTVGTVGVLRARPGAINVVPGEVELDVDVRDSDLARASRWCRPSWPPPREIGARRGLEVGGDADRRGRAGDLRRGVVAAAQEACRELDSP
jgi:hypothetical protein